MPLVNCELKFILTWLEDCVFSSVNERAKFKITVTKRYAPVSTLSTQDNAKLLDKLKSGFRRTINWNKYQPNVSLERQKQY